MSKAWDIMLDEVYDEDGVQHLCKTTKGADYDQKERTVRFSGTQERQNELCRAIKKFARIWGVILVWTFGAG
jgi:ABC-type transport system involved in cytochrome bd biosynthesis fused ATPase/permease subunit